MVAGTAGALAPILTKDPEAGPRSWPGLGAGAGPGAGADAANGSDPAPGPELERFAETYRGRHIQGTARRTGGSGRSGRARAVPAMPSVEVLIDGRPLHVMRRADGSYLSVVNHYESFPTLHDVARAAVDALGDAQLSMSPTHSL
ncbi:tyrosinase [Streptomyces sp. ISL-98]|nr:tyrosinase [Streptomyces sp. ISL-98]